MEFAESRRARLLAEKMRIRADKGAAARADLRALAGQLHAVLLSYWLAPRQSYLWVVTASEIRAFPLPPEPQIRGLVERYSQDHPGSPGSGPDVERRPARELYQSAARPRRAMLIRRGAGWSWRQTARCTASTSRRWSPRKAATGWRTR